MSLWTDKKFQLKMLRKTKDSHLELTETDKVQRESHRLWGIEES